MVAHAGNHKSVTIFKIDIIIVILYKIELESKSPFCIIKPQFSSRTDNNDAQLLADSQRTDTRPS